MGINSVSTEAINGYELRLRIRLASYQVRISIIGSDPLRYVGACPGDRWATVAGYWATCDVAGWVEPVGRLVFGPCG
jgi:hypothetical protein